MRFTTTTRTTRATGMGLLLLAVVFGGCRGSGDRARPGSKLEHAIFFSERGARGELHPISDVPATSDPTSSVERVADGATIDVNSKLTVEIRRDQLGRAPQLAGTEDLADVGRALAKALDAIEQYFDVEQRADLAFARREAIAPDRRKNSPEDLEFIQLRQRRGELELALLTPIRTLWSRQDAARTAQRREAEASVEALNDPETRAKAVEDLVALTQRRLAEWHREATAVAAAAKDEFADRKLRIEAFVLAGDGHSEPTAVHVPGYDTLDQHTVSVIDRFGVFLTEPEREQLVGLSAASHDVAASLERLRRGEATWQQALLDVSKVLPVVANLVELGKQLERDALQQRLQRTRTAWSTFLAEVRAAGITLAAGEEQVWQQALQQALAANESLATLSALILRLDALGKRWQQPTSADLPQLVLDSLALARELLQFAEEFEGQSLLVAFRGTLEQAIARIAAGAAGLRDKCKQAWQPVATDLLAWQTLGGDVLAGVRLVGGLLGAKRLPPKLNVSNVAAIDVPLETAADTEIDLRTTPRRPDDLLQVRVRLLDGATGQDAVTPLSATLGIDKLDWHADLVPLVAYVTADRLAGASDRGGFSPALSWMWSYTPRDDEGDTFLARTLGWGAGLHACFLNFDAERDVQMGLGATVSLWDNRLVGGVGYNLFAESEDDGRFYFFFGSSLIPLLQSLNGNQ